MRYTTRLKVAEAMSLEARSLVGTSVAAPGLVQEMSGRR